MASSTEPESSGYHAGDSESIHESELELQDRLSVARDLMDVLKAPTQADICRKRKVATNSTIPLRIIVRNRCKRPRCASNPGPGSVTPAQRVKEFPKEELKVSAGKVFCNACREELSTKKSTIENHVGSAKHTAGKKACKQGAEGTGHSRSI